MFLYNSKKKIEIGLGLVKFSFNISGPIPIVNQKKQYL